MDREHKQAALWCAITGVTCWLTWRAWQIAKHDQRDLLDQHIDGYTRVAASAAVRRERVRFCGQLLALGVGLPFLLGPSEERYPWQRISIARAVAPFGLIGMQMLLMLNSLADMYDRRRALVKVIDVPAWRRDVWGWLSIIWDHRGE